MKLKNPRYFFASLAVALIVLLLDQASKWWMLEVVRIHERPPIEVTGFFNLVMVWNFGISFGMLADHKAAWALILMALIIVAILLVWLARASDRWVLWGVGLVLGGAIGNIIDRIRFGAVADFLDFHAFGYHWPAFNVADSTIFMGVVVLCIQSIMQPKKIQDRL